MDYLPKDATIEQACDWLHSKTGQVWILPRLLESHLTPHFWLDYKPGYPAVYGDRIEGFQTRMMFQGDICRLESDGGDALVNMFAAHDGSLIKTEPGLRVPLSELRFKRDELEHVAEMINTAQAQRSPKPAPPVTGVAESRKAEPTVKPVVEPHHEAAAPRFSMNKAGLVSAHKHEWPTIETDLKSASENGLAFAKAGPRDWDEACVMEWARAKGKLTSENKPANDVTSAVHKMSKLPGRKHTLKG